MRNIESAGIEDRWFEPVPANQIEDLNQLCTELQLVEELSREMCRKQL